MTDFDVIVVGAGPAGSTAARHAALGGARVLLLEKKDEVGVPVQCGELLPSLATLREMFPRVPNIDDLFEIPRRCVSLQISKLTLFSPARREYELNFEARSLWRAKYDQHLARLAVEAGAELKTGSKVRALLLYGEELAEGLGTRSGPDVPTPDVPTSRPPIPEPRSPEDAVGVETEDETITAGVIIGADGPMSRIRRSLGIPAPVIHPCVQYTIPGDYGNGAELYFSALTPGGHVWLVPRSNGANIGLEMRARRQLRSVLDQFIWGLGIVDRPKIETAGVLPVSGPVPCTARGNVLLCGDAAGQALAFSGWGIATSVICGRAAGETAAGFLGGNARLPDYEKRWRSEVGDQLKASLWARKRMGRMALSNLTMELAFAFLRKRGIRRILGGKRPI